MVHTSNANGNFRNGNFLRAEVFDRPTTGSPVLELWFEDKTIELTLVIANLL